MNFILSVWFINAWWAIYVPMNCVTITGHRCIPLAGGQNCIMTSSNIKRQQTFSALLALCAGNSPATGEFPTQGPVTRSFDVFFVLRLNKRLSKQSWGWWFETPSRSLLHHCNGEVYIFSLLLTCSSPWNEYLKVDFRHHCSISTVMVALSNWQDLKRHTSSHCMWGYRR